MNEKETNDIFGMSIKIYNTRVLIIYTQWVYFCTRVYGNFNAEAFGDEVQCALVPKQGSKDDTADSIFSMCTWAKHLTSKWKVVCWWTFLLASERAHAANKMEANGQ
jgi:hypothetical protein